MKITQCMSRFASDLIAEKKIIILGVNGPYLTLNLTPHVLIIV